MTRAVVLLALGAASFGALVVACAEESADSERVDQGGGESDAGRSGDGQVDPTGGRKANSVECLTSCQNAFMTCFPKGAKEQTALTLTLEPDGCNGTYGANQKMVITCADLKVCLDGACSEGTFSALQLGFTPSGGPATVCYRD